MSGEETRCRRCGCKIGNGRGYHQRVYAYLNVKAEMVKTPTAAYREVRTTTTELSQKLGIDRGSVATVLRRLQKEGAIEWIRGQRGGGRGKIRFLP